MKSELVFGNRTGITIAGTDAGSSASDSAIFFCNDSGGVAALLLWTPLQMIHLAQAKLEMFSNPLVASLGVLLSADILSAAAETLCVQEVVPHLYPNTHPPQQ